MPSGAALPPVLAPRALPEAVRGLAGRLAAGGHRAWLVGPCVRDALQGVRPLGFEIAADAPRERLLALFERAFPVGDPALRVPCPDGPVRLTPLGGGDIGDALSRRDFTMNALAFEPARDELLDPHGGRDDLAAGLLRAVTPASLACDPLRALRAARLCAELGLRAAPELEEAMRAAAPEAGRAAPIRLRHELSRLLLAPGVQAGLALLRRTGVEAALAPGAPADAGEVAAALPAALTPRLAAWLRGTASEAILGRLRFPRERVRAVQRLLAHHPVEAWAGGDGSAALRRLARRGGESELAALFALRRAELRAGAPEAEPAAEAALASLERHLAELRREEQLARIRDGLALRGRDVIAHLGCAPGPRVGRALHHLARQVAADPARNERATLLALLDAWAEAGDPH